ncbi:hypothetical protein E2562_034104 [Oryza meyeriana var. granulata]|uniref:Uncharacterized protein n=1 Tax=Oryza meyeriana var. granulata TaxID=110450 RepID=A0A6G1E741_9ORYZ|nr:hypothetical protein E2562_034104 [Oryza meyeriana var. granulata]
MNSTNKPMAASHSGSSLLKAVPMLLLFSLGFILGMISIANFPKFYESPLLPPMLHSLVTSSPPIMPPPSPSPETPCVWPPLPSTPTPVSPPPTGTPAAPMGFTAPGRVMHNMTDEELRWRASMVPKMSRTPYSRVPKVAFLFLKTSWGDANLVEAERRLLANALLDLSNERFALLSESCIAIFDFPTVYAHLTGSNDSFVDCFNNAGARVRYRPDVFAPHNITAAQWRKGSQFFEMDRALAVEVVSDEPRKPHPRRHGARDVTEEVFRKMRSGAANCTYNGAVSDICFVFAHKFSPDALAPLLGLAPKVMGFG